jgi:hypothetical protein
VSAPWRVPAPVPRLEAAAGESLLPQRGRERVEQALAGLEPTRDRDAAPAQRAAVRVVDVLRDHGPLYLLERRLPEHEARVLGRLLECRTPGLGGQLVRCPDCGERKLLPNACRDRHCATCPAVRQWRWLEQRSTRALDVPHFHTVFTIPAELRALVFENRRLLYGALLASAAATVRWACARALGGATPAFSSVLHTWNRAQEFHPHVHVVLAAGGLSAGGARWIEPPSGQAMLAADDEVRARFRGALLRRIRRARVLGELRLPPGWDEARLDEELTRAEARRWHVYSKRALSSAEAYEYLSRYVRSLGISTARVLAYDRETVTIATREGRSVTLPGRELVRRHLLHVLPKGFTRVRHYGLFVSRHAANHALARRRIAEQGLGCGFAAELEGRAEESGGEGQPGGAPESEATWQAVCTRNGFAVERCPRCDVPLEYTRFPPSAQLAASFRAELFARARERAAGTTRGPP